MLREGYQIAFEPVGPPAPATTGASKYTNWGRLVASATDLLGVMWLRRRSRLPGDIQEAEQWTFRAAVRNLGSWTDVERPDGDEKGAVASRRVGVE